MATFDLDTLVLRAAARAILHGEIAPGQEAREYIAYCRSALTGQHIGPNLSDAPYTITHQAIAELPADVQALFSAPE